MKTGRGSRSASVLKAPISCPTRVSKSGLFPNIFLALSSPVREKMEIIFQMLFWRISSSIATRVSVGPYPWPSRARDQHLGPATATWGQALSRILRVMFKMIGQSQVRKKFLRNSRTVPTKPKGNRFSVRCSSPPREHRKINKIFKPNRTGEFQDDSAK